MGRLLVVYGTTEGQTRKVAERIGATARGLQHAATVRDATAVDAPLDGFDAAIVCGSLHQGRHQAAVEHVVRANLAALAARPGAFVSVSLAAAGDEEDVADAKRCAERFLDETGWRPDATKLVAGALRYTEYDWLKRFVLRLIARRKGAPTDTSRDHEFTDWQDLRRFVEGFVAEHLGGGRATAPA